MDQYKGNRGRAMSITKGLFLFHCEEGSSVLLKSILKKNPEYINLVDNHGNTPLFLAIKQRNYDLLKFFHSKGADVNTKNKSNQTPLLWATANEDLQGVKYLLDLGANINCLDNVILLLIKQ